MPLKPSAKKALRVARRKALCNLGVEEKLKRLLKKANAQNLAEIQSLLDRATKKRIIHKNKAARLKSKLFQKLRVKELAPRKKETPPPPKPKKKAKTTKKTKKPQKKHKDLKT